jgi:hypothetical protein
MTPLEIHQYRLLAASIRGQFRKAIKRTKESDNFSPMSLRNFDLAARLADTLVIVLKERKFHD